MATAASAQLPSLHVPVKRIVWDTVHALVLRITGVNVKRGEEEQIVLYLHVPRESRGSRFQGKHCR